MKIKCRSSIVKIITTFLQTSQVWNKPLINRCTENETCLTFLEIVGIFSDWTLCFQKKMTQPTDSATQNLTTQISTLSLSNNQNITSSLNNKKDLQTLLIEIQDTNPNKQFNALIEVRKLLSLGKLQIYVHSLSHRKITSN